MWKAGFRIANLLSGLLKLFTMAGMTVTFAWSGVNSLEFQIDGATLWVDPFFTRPPARTMFQPVACDRALVARHAQRADAVLVTHPHYDHLMDVPEVLRITGARAYGTPFTAAILRVHGLPEQQICVVMVGQQIDLGFCTVDVLPAWHTHTPLDRWINNPLTAETLARLRLPLRPIDYRMDASYTFRICAGGKTLLVGNYPAAADVVFVSPYLPQTLLRELIETGAPRMVVPVHWDDFLQPLTQPLRPMLVTRQHGLDGWKPVGRLDPTLMMRRVQAIDPRVRVLLPEPFHRYEI